MEACQSVSGLDDQRQKAAAGSRPLILLVDEDTQNAAFLALNLGREGFDVVCAASGFEAMARAHMKRPDLIVLDIVLPDIQGTDVCRLLKDDASLQNVPVVFLSSRNAEEDILLGFELGATDYVAKPFSVRELALRIRAILSRFHPEEEANILRSGPLVIDQAGHALTVEGDEVALTPQEFRLLVALVKAKGNVLSRTSILETIWDGKMEVYERTVDVHIKNLRLKLGAAAKYVETVVGVGYRLRR